MSRRPGHLGVVGVLGEGDNDADGLGEVVQVGESFGGEGVAVLVGEVEAAGVVARE